MQMGGKEEEVSMTGEDQKMINTFARLNNHLHDLDDQIKVKEGVQADLEDAESELILTDEEEVRYLSGEVFIHTPKDDVDALLETMKEKTSMEFENLVAEREVVLRKLAELKGKLYGKFKDQINLEED